MTSVFHQEMFNFIQKPQYRLLTNVWDDLGIPVPAHATIELSSGKDKVMPFSKAACIYDNIIVAYGSETGTSLKYANIVAGFIGDHCTGPLPLDEVSGELQLSLLKRSVQYELCLLLVIAVFLVSSTSRRARALELN